MRADDLHPDCPRCGGHRVERFIVGRVAVVACADCGTHEERPLRPVPDPWDVP